MEKEGQQQANAYTDKDTDYPHEGYNDGDYTLETETAAPKRLKRHTPEQIRELVSAYEHNQHPDAATRRALAEKIGLEARQVQYWFQNQRTQMQGKAVEHNSKEAQRENAGLLAENVSLRQAILKRSCFKCGGATVPAELVAENRRLLTENARLRGEYMHATTLLNHILRSAPPAEQRPAVLSVGEGASRDSRTTRLRRYAEAAMDQFLQLATKGEPLWLPTPDGEELSHHGYQKKVHHGFVMEATRETGIVRVNVADLIIMLTGEKRWSEMFPSIVASVTTNGDISGGVFCSNIQLMKAELRVQSPRLLNHRINFLRYNKRVAEGQWAVMDVSVDDGILGPLGSRTADAAAVAKNTACWQLLPSGCLIEDMGNGYSKITWVVHAEYDEATVPKLFRPLLRSGKAFGAHRWLASLQRQCEYLDVLHSSQVPRGDNDNTASTPISSMGKRGILELAQRMMVVFYSAVSGSVTQPSSNLYEWPASAGTGARRIDDAAVRMVTWKKAGSEADLVLSASTTVWLPNTPPQLVFQYLCDAQRRGEWDVFANGKAVTELCSVATGHLHGNAVSVLYSNVMTDGTDSKKVVMLQQACTDASCSMVVYAPVQEDFMRAVMDGGDHASVFLMPSGFAVLPDGRGRARNAPSSSSALVSRDNTAGSLLTVACQALLPGSSPSDNHADGVGELLCHTLKKIKAAVKANIAVPA